jgi:hypothetical protein
LFFGKSTPAIRATEISPYDELTLPLLVLGVLADHADNAFAPDNLAVFTDFFDR